ncbi:MAG: hypothetical protein ACYC3S_01855 [Chloroflexota bacterium]
MKRTVFLAALVGLIMSLTGLSAVSAASGVTWTSGVQVQNLEATQANVTLDFYRQDGLVAASAPYTIAASSSRTFFPLSDVTAGFNGSLVISSDRNVRATSNLLGSGNGSYLQSTNGFQEGATSVNLPLIMCNNSGFNTFFNVQNAGGATANVTITYKPGSNGTAGQSEAATILPGAAKTFDQSEGSSTKNCSALKDDSGKFIGSAVVTSDQPVVAVVSELNTTTFRALLGYGGFTAGSSTVALPLVMANNSGFYTSIQVQNTGSASTTVTVDYAANTVGAGNPTDESFVLAAGASKTIIQNAAPPSNGSTVNNWNSVGRYIGSALVTSTGGQTLVAVVNEVRPSPALGAAYEGFNPASATLNASAPLIMANNSTYYTSIQVQNVSVGSANVTIDYGPNTAGSFAPQNEVFPLAAGASKTIIQNAAPPSNGSTVNNWGANKYIGSATVTATGGNIVAIINQISLSVSGDQLASTDAFNY